MYARVLTVQIQPGMVDGMIDEYQKYAGTVQQQKGFQGAWQLVDRAAGKLMSITIWETRADLEATDKVNDKRAPQYASVFLDQRVREGYELGGRVEPAGEVGMRDQRQTMYARVQTASIQPSKANEVNEWIDAYRDYGAVWQRQRGFQGARQLIDR